MGEVTLPKIIAQLWPEQLPIGEIPLLIIAVAGVSLIIAGLILRRWTRSQAETNGPQPPRNRGMGWLVIGLGGFLLGASLVGSVLTFWGDPVEQWVLGLGGEGSIPVVLADADAEGLFTAYCVSCHGPGGDQVPGMALFTPEYLAQRSDSVIADAISEGTNGMPGFKLNEGRGLTQIQISSVIKFMRLGGSVEAVDTPTPTPTPELIAILGFDAFENNCGCHVRTSIYQWDDDVLRAVDKDVQGRRGLHDFTTKLSEEEIETLVHFIVQAQQSTESGAPFGGIIRHVDAWKQRHPGYVRANDASFCYQCHAISYCVDCHTQGQFPKPTPVKPSSGGG